MRLSRRLLAGLIISLAVAFMCAGAFWLGVLVGEMRGHARLAFGWEHIERPWPFSPFPFGGWFGWKGPGGKHGALGIVEEIEEGSIVITDRWSTRLRIVITKETVFRRGWERTTLAEVHVGDRIAVIGSPGGEGEIEAKVIWVLSRRPQGWNGLYHKFFPLETMFRVK